MGLGSKSACDRSMCLSLSLAPLGDDSTHDMKESAESILIFDFWAQWMNEWMNEWSWEEDDLEKRRPVFFGASKSNKVLVYSDPLLRCFVNRTVRCQHSTFQHNSYLYNSWVSTFSNIINSTFSNIINSALINDLIQRKQHTQQIITILLLWKLAK